MQKEEMLARNARQPGRPNGRSRSTLASIVTLGVWSLRQTWWQMALVGLSLVTAVMVACVVPLFSTVATTASLQEVFGGNSLRSDFALNVSAQGLSTEALTRIYQRFNPLVRPIFGSYLDAGQAPLVIQLPSTAFSQPGSAQDLVPMTIYATSLRRLEPDLKLVQGRWPSVTPGVLEVMMSSVSARGLHLSIGAEWTLSETLTTKAQDMQTGPGDPSLVLHAKLVGTFDVPAENAPALLGQDFQPVASSLGATYTALVPEDALLAQADQWAAQGHSPVLFSTQPFQLTWYYHLNVARLQTSQVNDLLTRLNAAEQKIGLEPSDQQGGFAALPTFPYVLNSQFYNPLPQGADMVSLLQQYTSRVALVNIPVLVLTIQVLLLLFFFASLLLNMLIDRQMIVNALLSSRGASPRQVFWSLVAQGLVVCLLALLLGPLLAALLVIICARQVLSTTEQGIVTLTLGHVGQIAGLLAPDVGGTVLVSALLVCFVLRRSVSSNILEVRRESSRASKRPLWLRYYLDVLAATIALSGFGVSLYLASVARALDAGTQDLIITPLTLVAPLFLLLAFLLLFLRLYPLFLRLGAWCVRPARGITGMLALVQMARAPRPAMQMTMLLALAVSFVFFALVLDASQAQRALDIAAYESGADFSGGLPDALSSQTLKAVIGEYAHIQGVLAASAGFVSDGSTTGFDENDVMIDLRAVDAQSFAHTALWGPVDSTQPLPTLMALLLKQSSTLSQEGLVPVIVDESTASQLDVTVGSTFLVTLTGLMNTTLGCQVVAVVMHIPAVNNSASISDTSSPGGILTDYTTLQKVYQNQVRRSPGSSVSVSALPVNYLWLRTRSDDHSLAVVRNALNTSQLGLSNLYDRREIIVELQHDPLYFNLLLLLSIGGAVALTLALVGDLVASWLSVRTRRSTFVVLRALGASSGCVAALLFCEQALIYLGALVLSLVFGLVLIRLAVPALVFTGLPASGGMSSLSTDALYALQQIIPVQVVIPLAVRLALVGLAVLCILTLTVMVSSALHPSMIQELRLNED